MWRENNCVTGSGAQWLIFSGCVSDRCVIPPLTSRWQQGIMIYLCVLCAGETRARLGGGVSLWHSDILFVSFSSQGRVFPFYISSVRSGRSVWCDVMPRVGIKGEMDTGCGTRARQTAEISIHIIIADAWAPSLNHEHRACVLKPPSQRASIRLIGNVKVWVVEVKTSLFAATVAVSSA